MSAMAAKRSAEQRGEVASFVRELYAQSGAATQKEFANRAQVHPMQMSDWLLGKSVPDGWNLLCLIRAAGGVPPIRSLEEVVRIAEGRILAVEILDVSGCLGEELLQKTLKAEAAVLT